MTNFVGLRCVGHRDSDRIEMREGPGNRRFAQVAHRETAPARDFDLTDLVALTDAIVRPNLTQICRY